jgi:hypothetical protein
VQNAQPGSVAQAFVDFYQLHTVVKYPGGIYRKRNIVTISCVLTGPASSAEMNNPNDEYDT